MRFRDLKRQYAYNRTEIDRRMRLVIDGADFIGGEQVRELEAKLAEYVGVDNCVSCGNGTDALQLALMAWDVGKGDAVFVPDFTFFASGEAAAATGATPVFVDVDADTYTIDADALERAVAGVIAEGSLKPRVIVAVDLFGLPADYASLRKLADRYGLLILEDGAQGFGGEIDGRRACSFGDISTTSFFPAKPLGCYGDGGAVFTNDGRWAERIASLKVHGKGQSKYDNVRIGMNSRLDTLQAAVLLAKFPVFAGEELARVQRLAEKYGERLSGLVKTPCVPDGYYSSWAQYTLRMPDEKLRDMLQGYLSQSGIPSMVYYRKPLHRQEAFGQPACCDDAYRSTEQLCGTVLSLPFHPYMEESELHFICDKIEDFFKERR